MAHTDLASSPLRCNGHTDVLVGLVKDIARFRDDIKIIISSATLNAEAFSGYFDDAAIFNIPGRAFDVEILYTKAPGADSLARVGGYFRAVNSPDPDAPRHLHRRPRPTTSTPPSSRACRRTSRRQ